MKIPDNPEFKAYYEKHGKHLKLKGLRPKTIDAYSRAIRRIGTYFDGHIDNLGHEQLLDYFSELQESHSWSTVKLDLYGLKFFYRHVLDRPWTEVSLVKPPRATRIPDILGIEEADRLFNATRELSFRVFFFTLYSMGLRLGECQRLEVGDIDAKRQRVLVRNAKGNKDRFVPLPEASLRVLRGFWSQHRHPVLLFPSRRGGLEQACQATVPLGRGSIQAAMRAVVDSMGLKKRSPATASGTAMPHTCWKPALTCGRSSASWAMPAC